MITIFDRYFHIKNKGDMEDVTYEKLDKLSSMLTEYGASHSFSLTSAEEIKKIEDAGNEYCVTLQFEEKNKILVELIYMLWAKVELKASDEKIKDNWVLKAGIKEVKEKKEKIC